LARAGARLREIELRSRTRDDDPARSRLHTTWAIVVIASVRETAAGRGSHPFHNPVSCGNEL
jgi:hypothetical protein